MKASSHRRLNGSIADSSSTTPSSKSSHQVTGTAPSLEIILSIAVSIVNLMDTMMAVITGAMR